MAHPLSATNKRDWFGQPRGLTILFMTDTWSLFSYFGMRTLLVYYMMKQLHMPQAEAAVIYGTYAAFSNFAPLIGGVVSDRWLGRRLSVTMGGAAMAVGHFMMVSEALFYPALIFILLGFGLFMPNLPSQISGLYAPNDPRKSSAYNVYYAGINLGAFFAPLVCGTIGEIYGWHYGFAVAGIGMFIAMAIYWWGGRYLPTEAEIVSAESPAAQSDKNAPTLRERLRVLLGVALALLVLRMAYDQQGNVLAVWIDESIDRQIGAGWAIPMTWFQSINPLVIFMLTPWIVIRWKTQAAKGKEWSSSIKMLCGALLMGLSFLILAATAFPAGDTASKVSWLWLSLSTVILTVGELFVLPVALGMFGRFAPSGAKATVIACYFMAAFFGNLLAGYIGSYWTYFSPASYFVLMAVICCISAFGFFVLARGVTGMENRLR
jgi:proton-dependent oligopeptide transporter, POT family